MSFVSFLLHAREAPDRRDRRAHGGRETDPKYVRTPASPGPQATRAYNQDPRARDRARQAVEEPPARTNAIRGWLDASPRPGACPRRRPLRRVLGSLARRRYRGGDLIARVRGYVVSCSAASESAPACPASVPVPA